MQTFCELELNVRLHAEFFFKHHFFQQFYEVEEENESL